MKGINPPIFVSQRFSLTRWSLVQGNQDTSARILTFNQSPMTIPGHFLPYVL